MSTHLKTDPLHPKAREGIELYNLGKYYEAHEPLEESWMETEAPERILYQGILQIGLAYYQISRGNYRGALKMFLRAQRNLTPLEDALFGIDINQLREDAHGVEIALRQLGPEKIEELDWELIKDIPEIP